MPFGSLWLPVLVSAGAVWMVSAVLHMVLKYHRSDYKQLSDEAAVAPPLRKSAPTPGVYAIPYMADPSHMKDPAFQKKYQEGPVALITVMPNATPGLGKYLVQWLAYCFLVSFVTGYLARHTLSVDSPAVEIMRITGTAAFLAYGFGAFQDSIWRGIPWSNSLKNLFDAAVYAVVTGLIFRFLWP